MSAAERWERVEGSPAPKPLAQLSRPQLAGRVHTLRSVLALLEDRERTDGSEAFRSRGRIKIELQDLEADLRRRDRAAEQGEPIPTEVLLAVAGRTA